MEEIKFLDDVLKNYVKALEEVIFDEQPKTITIDSAFFSKEIDDENETKKKSLRVQDILEEHKKSPILYWFAFSDGFNKQEELYKFYNDFITENKVKEYEKKEYYNFREKLVYRRAFSAIKSKNEADFKTKTLYVGKVESKIWGRLAVHSGWGTSPKTGGLQLPYWYDFEKYGNLTFNYLVFDSEMKYFVEVLEKELRKKLNPLIGKK